jgi:hypothetical protein
MKIAAQLDEFRNEQRQPLPPGTTQMIQGTAGVCASFDNMLAGKGTM